MKDIISQNTTESEVIGSMTMKNGRPGVVKLDDFAAQKSNAKSPVQALVKHISREVNRHKLSYDQLKYVFKSVRATCGVDVPTRGRKLYELPSKEEIEQFYGAIDNPVHRLIFETLEGTGLRISELCNLQVSRIDFKTNLAFVSEGKGKKDRVIIIGNRLLEKLALYLEGRNNKFLFESNRHTKFSPRRIEQLCKRYKEKAGITKQMTPHTLRHLWNTKLAESGISKEKRMLLAGHESEATQKIYTHLGVGGAKEEVLAILDKI